MNTHTIEPAPAPPPPTRSTLRLVQRPALPHVAMSITRLAAVLLLVASFATPAHALLREFSVVDGYMFPFSTRVWTYNPLWHFDGGSINNNYVAQHGYNSGFAFNEPYALVIRNDNAAGNYRFHYDFEPGDLAGLSPSNLSNAILQMSFDLCSTVAQNSTIDNGAAMLTMKFGGTAANPGLTLGLSDGNYLMWSDGAGNLQEFIGYKLNATGWDRVTLTFDFVSDTYSLSVSPMTGDGINASNTYTPTSTFNIVSGMSFTNPMNSMENLFFETFTDPENGLGWHKMFLDNFTTSVRIIPEPTTAPLVVGGLAILGLALRRRGSVFIGRTKPLPPAANAR